MQESKDGGQSRLYMVSTYGIGKERILAEVSPFPSCLPFSPSTSLSPFHPISTPAHTHMHVCIQMASQTHTSLSCSPREGGKMPHHDQPTHSIAQNICELILLLSEIFRMAGLCTLLKALLSQFLE